MIHLQLKHHYPGEGSNQSMPGAGLLLILCLLIAATTITAQTNDIPGGLPSDDMTNSPPLIAVPQAADAAVTPDEQKTANDDKLKSNIKNNRTASAAESTTKGSPAEPAQQLPGKSRSNKLTTAIEKFTPTEEIKVDNAVPFPVDI